MNKRSIVLTSVFSLLIAGSLSAQTLAWQMAFPVPTNTFLNTFPLSLPSAGDGNGGSVWMASLSSSPDIFGPVIGQRVLWINNRGQAIYTNDFLSSFNTFTSATLVRLTPTELSLQLLSYSNGIIATNVLQRITKTGTSFRITEVPLAAGDSITPFLNPTTDRRGFTSIDASTRIVSRYKNK